MRHRGVLQDCEVHSVNRRDVVCEPGPTVHTFCPRCVAQVEAFKDAEAARQLYRVAAQLHALAKDEDAELATLSQLATQLIQVEKGGGVGWGSDLLREGGERGGACTSCAPWQGTR